MRSLAAAFTAIQAVAAQTLFTTLFVNDVNQGNGTCIRMPWYTQNATAPVTDLTSDDMACGHNGTLGVARVCTVYAGDMLTFQFKESPDGSRSGVLGSGYKGPCCVYMKYVDSAINDTATGNGWFKIWDQGYDNTTSQWCTDELVATNGLFSLALPLDLVGGYYLVRPEIMSLQKTNSTPSFFTGCAQIFLNSSANTLPKDVVSIPGYVNATDPSLHFNIPAPKLPYTIPGPQKYVSQVSPTVQQSSVQNQSEGLLPPNVVLTNANWFGIELESYSTAAGCKNATGSCFNQSSSCYSSAGPIGTANCDLWNAKCNVMLSTCNSGDYVGPPNQGKIPTSSSILPSTTATTSQQRSSPTDPASATSGTFSSLLIPDMSAPSSDTADTALSTITSRFLLSSLTSTLTSCTSAPIPNSTNSALGPIASASFSDTAITDTNTITSMTSSDNVVPTPSPIASVPASGAIITASNTVASSSFSGANLPISSHVSPIPLVPGGAGSTLNTVASPSISSPTTSGSNTVVVIATVTAPAPTSTLEIVQTSVIFTAASNASILSLQILPTSNNSTPSLLDLTSTSSTSSADIRIYFSTPSIDSSSLATLISDSPTLSTYSSGYWFTSTVSSSSSTSPISNSSASISATTSSPSSGLGANELSTFGNGPLANAKISPDGTCGPEVGFICLGNQNGPCCSSQGYCGATEDYCGKMFCQPDWGYCDVRTPSKMIRHRNLNRRYWSTHA